MYYGFIYEWTNMLNGKKYIGSHAGTLDTFPDNLEFVRMMTPSNPLFRKKQ